MSKQAKSEQQKAIEKKKDLVNDLNPNEEMKSELNYQIEICEYLGCPITETQIREWVNLTVNRMLCKVHTHKFA